MLVLVEQLPDTSRLHGALSATGPGWGTDRLMTAALVHALLGANWQRGGGKGPQPKPWPIPGDEKRADAARLARYSALMGLDLPT